MACRVWGGRGQGGGPPALGVRCAVRHVWRALYTYVYVQVRAWYLRCAGVERGSMPKERSAMSCALRMRRFANMERVTSASIARYMRIIGTIETTDCTCEESRGGYGCVCVWGGGEGCGGLRGVVGGARDMHAQHTAWAERRTADGAADGIWCAAPHRELDRYGRVEQREVAAREADLAPLQRVARDAPSLRDEQQAEQHDGLLIRVSVRVRARARV
jgi:hypothetical protein